MNIPLIKVVFTGNLTVQHWKCGLSPFCISQIHFPLRNGLEDSQFLKKYLILIEGKSGYESEDLVDFI